MNPRDQIHALATRHYGRLQRWLTGLLARRHHHQLPREEVRDVVELAQEGFLAIATLAKSNTAPLIDSHSDVVVRIVNACLKCGYDSPRLHFSTHDYKIRTNECPVVDSEGFSRLWLGPTPAEVDCAPLNKLSFYCPICGAVWCIVLERNQPKGV